VLLEEAPACGAACASSALPGARSLLLLLLLLVLVVVACMRL
jgi:hypothetical protein